MVEADRPLIFPANSERFFNHRAQRWVENPKRPSPKKVRRGIKLIEAFSVEIYHYIGPLTQRVNPFKQYPNWQSEYEDYRELLRIARDVAKRGDRFKVQHVGFGGESGSQLITQGLIIKPGAINPLILLDRAVDKIYKREQEEKQPLSDEEVRARLKSATTPEDFERLEGDLVSSCPRSKDQIRESLFPKWQAYLDQR